MEEKLEEEKQANAGQQQAIKYLKSVMEHNNFEEIYELIDNKLNMCLNNQTFDRIWTNKSGNWESTKD